MLWVGKLSSMGVERRCLPETPGEDRLALPLARRTMGDGTEKSAGPNKTPENHRHPNKALPYLATSVLVVLVPGTTGRRVSPNTLGLPGLHGRGLGGTL